LFIKDIIAAAFPSKVHPEARAKSWRRFWRMGKE
jgi:hypothetical protein